MEKTLCHSCGTETEYQCSKCEQPVCDKCTVPFTMMNQIDYILCNDCHDSYERERSEEHYEDSLTNDELVRYRKEKRIVSGILNAIKKRGNK